MEEYRKVTYTTMLTEGKLNSYLADIDKQAQKRLEKEGDTDTKSVSPSLSFMNYL